MKIRSHIYNLFFSTFVLMTFYFVSSFSMAQSYQVTDLETLDGVAFGTYGYGINNGGEMVGTSGFSATTETSHPFIWSRSHGLALPSISITKVKL